MMQNTWTGLPDIEDTPNEPRDLEAEQEEAMQEKLGLELWSWLTLMEGEDER